MSGLCDKCGYIHGNYPCDQVKNKCSVCKKELDQFEGYGGHYGYEHKCEGLMSKKSTPKNKKKKDKVTIFYATGSKIDGPEFAQEFWNTLKEAEDSLHSSGFDAIWKLEATLAAEYKLTRISND